MTTIGPYEPPGPRMAQKKAPEQPQKTDTDKKTETNKSNEKDDKGTTRTYIPTNPSFNYSLPTNLPTNMPTVTTVPHGTILPNNVNIDITTIKDPNYRPGVKNINGVGNSTAITVKFSI